MKKRTKIIGLFAGSFLIAGTLMKYLHLMGANVVFGIGVLSTVFGFTLFLTLDRFSYEQSTLGKVNKVIGYIGAGSYLLGFGLNFLKYPFSYTLMGAGGLILLVYFFLHDSRSTN